MNVPKQGCCGPVRDRVKVIKQVINATHQAHKMLADLYATLAKDLPGESAAFLEAEKHQRNLAEESLKATIPDEIESEDDEAAR